MPRSPADNIIAFTPRTVRRLLLSILHEGRWVHTRRYIYTYVEHAVVKSHWPEVASTDYTNVSAASMLLRRILLNVSDSMRRLHRCYEARARDGTRTEPEPNEPNSEGSFPSLARALWWIVIMWVLSTYRNLPPFALN